MPNLDQDLEKIKEARVQLAQASKALYRSKLIKQKAAGDAASSSVLSAHNKEYTLASTKLQELLVELYRNDHKRLVAGMTAAIPVLFLPIRIETRFVTVHNGSELWIRIYPDDIHVHSHEPVLTEGEYVSGKQYWLNLLKANRENTAVEDLKKAAWQGFVEGRGVQRGLWVAKQSMPANWAADLTIADQELVFPAPGETKTHVWTQAPRTQIFPDKFVVNIYKNKEVVHSVVGAQVPDTVFLGPDPLQTKDAFEKVDDAIVLDESFAWITDFEQAVTKGLAMKIKLQDSYFNHGTIERIIVMGVCSSSSILEGQELLENMFENHQYSAKGFSFLPQRSPTNNTEKSGSVYSKNENFFPKGYFEGKDLNDLNDPDEDGRQFAKLLGIDQAVLKNVNHATVKYNRDAMAMNKAMYPATIGNFVDRFLEPVIKDAGKIKLRDFFSNFVTATGPLPAIRIGDQPYSFLITSDLGQWSEHETFFQELTSVLKKLQLTWEDITAEKVAHVGSGGDPSTTLLDILGLEAGSVSFKQRLGHLPDFSLAASNYVSLVSDMEAKRIKIFQYLDSLESKTNSLAYYPEISNLHYYKFLNDIPLFKLIDGKAVANDRFLDKLGAKALNYIEWLVSVDKEESLSTHNLGASPPSSILYLLLRFGLLKELEKGAKDFYVTHGLQLSATPNKSFLNVNQQFKDLTDSELLKGTPSNIDSKAFTINVPLADHILATGLNNGSRINTFKDALKVIANLSTATLQHHLTDHIDLCSYRLDAWQMGLFNRRLQQNRNNQPAGIYLGAYGWVENLRPSARKANAGFIQTPSLNHATAAGLLLAGYQNHATRSDPGAFAVNISSERVRRAIFLIQGVQNNQRLEALLGYQFERALHDITASNAANNLNRYILAFRNMFPLDAASIPQVGTEAQETVPAYAVVDGLKVVNAGVDVLMGMVSEPGHQPLILRERDRLADSLDAINDLLISETAFQATQGKTDRTAAVLNALKNADLPPELEFSKTPRSTHLSFTNRVTVHFDPKASQQAAENWPVEPSPRSLMEPGLNQWLGNMIGDPTKIISNVFLVDPDGNERNQTRITLAELKMQPVDVVYMVGIDRQSGIKDLESKMGTAFIDPSEVPADRTIKIIFDASVSPGERNLAKVFPLIRSLKTLITIGRAASAKDFSIRPKTQAEQLKFVPNWDLDELTRRLNVALESLKAELLKVDETLINPDLPEHPATLKVLFNAYYIEGAAVEKLEQTRLPDQATTALDAFILAGQKYGVKTSSVPISVQTDAAGITNLLIAAASLWKSFNHKLDVATKKIAEANGETKPDLRIMRLTEAGKALLGDDFLILPSFKYANPEEVAKVLADDGKQLLDYISTLKKTSKDLALESWFDSVSRVRSNMAALEKVRIMSEAQGNTDTTFTAAQFPYIEKNNWLAVEFPALDEQTGERFDILDDTVAMAILGAQARKVDEFQSALLVDEWTEAIPNKKEISGVSFNYDQPNATAPNAVLLAVEPTGGTNWNWDILLGILNNTLDRAKTRAVEPAHLMEHKALDTLLPMTVASFDLREANISLDYLTVNDVFLEAIKGLNLELYSAYK